LLQQTELETDSCKDKQKTIIETIEYHSSDEKTGIQALERKMEPMQPNKVEKREPEYIRNGTQCLIASRSINTGKIDAYSVSASRKEEDYVEHVKQIVTPQPQSKHVIICDNLNTHKSESFVRLIAEIENTKEDLGIKGNCGILKSMENRQKFLEIKEHKVSFIYTPKHCSMLNQIENWFGLLENKVIKRGAFSSTDDLKNKIISYIEYYNSYGAKPYVWKKTATQILKKFKT